jgi:tetratricopeptide (TPR) repeat protein
MDSEKYIEWIEQYLEGKLTGDELKAFEKKMAADSSFTAEVKLQKEIAEAMAEEDVMALSRKIRTIQHQKKRQSAGSGRIIIFRRLLQIAAGVALIVAAYFVYENFGQTYTPQELAAQYFFPEKQISHSVSDTDRSRDPDSSVHVKNELSKKIDAIWLEIESLYKQKNYKQALEKLLEIQTLDHSFETQSADEFYFYRGLFLMQDGDPKSAIPAFQQVKMTYTEKASWYSALSYLELGDVENAKKQLENILSNDLHYFKESAEKLIIELEAI